MASKPQDQHADRAHALFSASASDRWMKCPASLKLSAMYPDKSNPSAEEGTKAHERAELILLGGAPINVPVKDDPYVLEYVEFCRSLPGEHFVEVRVDFSEYAPDGFGTADFIAINGDHIHVVDLKYGQGIAVEAEENSQMQLYALGAIKAFGWLVDFKTVTMTVYQPRINNVNSWAIDVDTLMAFGERVKAAVELCLSPSPDFNPGEKQCQWCRHNLHCEALYQYNIEALPFDVITDDAEQVDVIGLSDDQLRAIMERAPSIIKFLGNVKEHITEKLMENEPFPGFKLVPGRSTRQWADPETASTILSCLVTDPAELYEPASLLSVSKVEKIIGKKVMAQYTDLILKSEPKPTLVPESDKRQSIGAAMFDDESND